MKKSIALFAVLLLLVGLLCCVGCNQESNDGGNSGGGSYTDDQGNDGGTTVTDYNVRLFTYSGDYKDFVSDGENIGLTSLPTRSGYTLKGIYDSPDGGSLFIKADGTPVQLLYKDVTLYCQWEAKSFRITLSTPNGRIDQNEFTVSTDERITLPTPLYNTDQWSFVGWFWGDTQVSDGAALRSAYEFADWSWTYGEEMALEARFTGAELKVVFDYNDGSYEREEHTAGYGEDFNFEFPTLTGVNKEVLYWSADPSGSVPYSPDKIVSNLTLYAIWCDTTVVRFHTDGTNYTESKYYRGDTITVPTPERAGYEFDGWYTSENYFGNPITTFTFGMLAKNYYAKWTPIEYTLTLSVFGETFETFSYTAPDTLLLPTPPEKRGYTFLGWKDSTGKLWLRKEADEVFGDRLTAEYKANSYRVTYESDGSVIRQINVAYDETLAEYIPEKSGYRFLGFTLNGERFTVGVFDYTADITLVAEWEVIYYSITYHLNGGTNDAENPLKYTIHDTVTPKAPSKEHYFFEGWFADAAFTQPVTEIPLGSTEDIQLYAKFKGESFAAKLDPMSGECISEKSILEYGADYRLPICTREGYSFDGWFTDLDGAEMRLTDADGNSVVPWGFSALETRVFAKYVKRYYVTLELNYSGAANIAVGAFYLKGDTVELDFTYDGGYQFVGYYTVDGTALCYSTKYRFVMPESDVTLKVNFEPKVVNVSFDLGEAVCDKDKASIRYDQFYTLPVAYKTGSNFAGWKYGDTYITDETGASLQKCAFTSDITVTPGFVESVEGVMLIRTVEDLLAMTGNGKYVLATNIDLSGYTWTPIDFTGELNGLNNKIYGLTTNLFKNVTGTIKNLKVEGHVTLENIEATESQAALLAVEISGGTVENVTVGGSIEVTGRYVVGGLASKLSGGTVIGCDSTVTINCTDTSGVEYGVGGLIGNISGGTLKKSTNHGSVTGGCFVGGVVGRLVGGGSIRELTNYGTVNGVKYVGGVIGYFYWEAGSLTLENLYLKNEGSVNGADYVGGVFGFFENHSNSKYSDYVIRMSYLYNSGTVEGSGTYVGGIFGYLRAYNGSDGVMYVYMMELHNTGNVNGSSYVGGLVGYAFPESTGSYIKASSSKNCAVVGDYIVGGLAGKLENIILDTCSNEGMTVTCNSYQADGTDHNAYFGGYVGWSNTVQNCVNYAELTYTKDGRFVGGIAGYANGFFSNCENKAIVSAPLSDYVGGICGNVSIGGEYTMEENKNVAKITGNGYVGGLFGGVSNITSSKYSDYVFTIKNQINSGIVEGSGTYVGGIFGYLRAYNGSDGVMYVYMMELHNTGNVNGSSYVGGLVGYAFPESTGSYIKASSSKNCAVVGDYIVGGLAGKLENIILDTCSNEGMTVTARGYLLDGANMYAYFGGYAGYCFAITNCENAVNISYDSMGVYVGGIAGYCTGSLNGCTNKGTISAPNINYVGGIAGYATVSGQLVTGCTNEGTVAGHDYVGGLVGSLYYSVSDRYNNHYFTFENSANSGRITGNTYVGGLVGRFYGINTHNSVFYATLNVLTNTASINGASYVGGLFGEFWSEGGSTMNLSSNTGMVTGEENTDSIAGKNTNLTIN